MDTAFDLYNVNDADWRERLAYIVETMKQTSRFTRPQDMVAAYALRMRSAMPSDWFLSVSRRKVEPPKYVIARSQPGDPTRADPDDADPWTQRHRLPVMEGGVLGELIYGNEPAVIDDLRVAEDDPAHGLIGRYRSLVAVPVYDGGESMNMIFLLFDEPGRFDPTRLPQTVWTTNLFGRATHNLVLSEELKRAYEMVDREMKTIADIQRALLPDELPAIATMDVATFYEPATRAGGDYYDFFDLGNQHYGILIADVSGHGSPAAVHMAITHTLAHTCPRDTVCPAALLHYVNDHMARKTSGNGGTFVTAFFGVYNAADRTMTYASAGHPPPRVKRCRDGSLFTLSGETGIPLGILEGETYPAHEIAFSVGDQIIFYTDGITEAFNPQNQMFGAERLDEAIENCALTARGLIEDTLAKLHAFTAGREADDDRTVIVAKIT